MTGGAPLLSRIRELGVEHLGELNLLLEALHAGPRAHRELTQSISRMAGRSDRIPNAQLYLEIATELGIVLQNGTSAKLTSLGQRLWNESTLPPYDVLNLVQKQTLAPELLGHPEVVAGVESALRLFTQIDAGTKVFRLGSIRLDEPQCLVLEILQALEMASVDNEYVTIATDGLRTLRRMLGHVAAQSEVELWRSVQEINERAREAEEYVVEYERRRLMHAGCEWLADSIERISKYDAKANYDVRSYELDGSIRYIEVKSSTNLRVEFLWSKAERDFAENKRGSYWIYFIPRSHELPNLRHSLVLIQNPHAFIGAHLSEEAATYRVTLTDHIDDIQRVITAPDTASITLAAPY